MTLIFIKIITDDSIKFFKPYLLQSNLKFSHILSGLALGNEIFLLFYNTDNN